MIDPFSYHLSRNAGQHGPIMLVYHSISPHRDTPSWPWAISIHRFRDQLDFLRSEGWSTITMKEAVDLPGDLGNRTAIITFDDGYVDNLSAYEELKKREIQATWFIVTGFIGCKPGWTSDDRPNIRLLNTNELKMMESSNMEIGSHSVSHVRLTDVNDAVLKAELANSKSMLEDILGNRISSFAYPYGAWNPKSAHAVQQAGYKAACTTDSGWAMVDADYFRLRRITIYNSDTINTFARKLAFADNDVNWSKVMDYYLLRLSKKLKVES